MDRKFQLIFVCPTVDSNEKCDCQELVHYNVGRLIEIN